MKVRAHLGPQVMGQTTTQLAGEESGTPRVPREQGYETHPRLGVPASLPCGLAGKAWTCPAP